ncbi:hypothetical protein Mgra_00004314 [Meloidogyne graminicola]|uniref:Uncharacterized protein n=1 Tax=Meloidogyne graminicola TaxID=189291 RepID=A0A8S9ZSV0_9BILA|nr:hypothetical protein Mgra_00004314 [Meloidogyne graminicola]
MCSIFNQNKLCELPPEAEQILGPDVWGKINEIKNNSTLSFQDKRIQIHQLFSTLPQETINKLPLPKEFDNLPQEVREKIKAILHQKLTPEKKKEEFDALYKTLSPEIQKQFCG